LGPSLSIIKLFMALINFVSDSLVADVHFHTKLIFKGQDFYNLGQLCVVVHYSLWS